MGWLEVGHPGSSLWCLCERSPIRQRRIPALVETEHEQQSRMEDSECRSCRMVDPAGCHSSATPSMGGVSLRHVVTPGLGHLALGPWRDLGARSEGVVGGDGVSEDAAASIGDSLSLANLMGQGTTEGRRRLSDTPTGLREEAASRRVGAAPASKARSRSRSASSSDAGEVVIPRDASVAVIGREVVAGGERLGRLAGERHLEDDAALAGGSEVSPRDFCE